MIGRAMASNTSLGTGVGPGAISWYFFIARLLPRFGCASARLAEARRPRQCGGIISAMSTLTVRNMCPMNCHTTFCGMLVNVADHGRLLADRGVSASPYSRRFRHIRSHQPTSPNLLASRRRVARVIAIDVRRAEASRHADETLLIRPGTDAALALALAHVIVAEGFVDHDFIARHTVGFEKYAEHLIRFTPEWAAAETGLAAADIRRLAREYASVKPSMIVVGGASMYKHRHGWEPGRAVATLPALTGQLGLAGGGLGPRHRAFPTGDHLADLTAVDRRAPGPWVPSHMSSIAQ